MSAADDLLDELFAYFSPEDACKRFAWHLLRWQQDWVDRRDVYRQAVQDALPTLPPESADHLRRVWDGLEQRMDAETDEQAAEIDAWLEPLFDLDGAWFDVLDAPYFTPAIKAECTELARVAGDDFELLVMALIAQEGEYGH